jgi:hypothetical protein
MVKRRFAASVIALLVLFVLPNCKYPTSSSTSTSSGGPSTCETFYACGGSLSGAYSVDTLCPSGDLNAELFAESNLPAACSGIFQNAAVTATGTLSYTDTAETSDITATIDVTVGYTENCLSAVMGQTTTMDLATCTGLQSQWASRTDVDSVSCSLVGTMCSCALSEVRTFNTVTAYTTSGNTIAYTTGAFADYCVSGSTLAIVKPNLFGTLSATISAHQ